MKKLILAVVFLGGMTAQADTVTHLDHGNKKGIRYYEPQSITFIERGVQFVVFTDGQFDFAPVRPQVSVYGRRGHQVQGPGTTYGVTYRPGNRGFVKYDRWGNIHKVGRSYLNYNRFGQVNQIGSVSLRYRNGRLVRVGDMQIVYNRRGYIVNLIGYVHHDHTNCGICGINGCTTDHFDYHDGYHNWDYRNDRQRWHGKKNRHKTHKKWNRQYR